MSISEEKMRIVIDNYFKSECDVNTSIRQAFEKGFRIGVKKGQPADRQKGEWIKVESKSIYKDVIYGRIYYQCPFCMDVNDEDSNFCQNCGAEMKG